MPSKRDSASPVIPGRVPADEVTYVERGAAGDSVKLRCWYPDADSVIRRTDPPGDPDVVWVYGRPR